jgi:hypothetical protein
MRRPTVGVTQGVRTGVQNEARVESRARGQARTECTPLTGGLNDAWRTVGTLAATGRVNMEAFGASEPEHDG